jgi:hypothetical protein
MPPQRPLPDNDNNVTLSYVTPVQQFGDAVLLGQWFVFIKPDWLQRTGFEQLLTYTARSEPQLKPTILYRGQGKISLPGAELMQKLLPQPALAALTSDKQLYRANHDTVRLLIVAPLRPKAQIRLKLFLNGNPYAEHPLTLDEYGLCLWSLRDLPEGEYRAMLDGIIANTCHFEVAEYRLTALNAELSEQQLSGQTLSYTLTVTAFGQPYSGTVEIELQERGRRVGQRTKVVCDRNGLCRGRVTLTGAGPYTLNVIAGERTATVALKGSERQRRETLTISELGQLQEMSLLPLPTAEVCRGLYVAPAGANTEPLLVQRVIGEEIELTARADIEALRIVTINPSHRTSVEKYYEQVVSGQQFRLPVPPPYGIVLLGAFIGGKAWEGWCAALRPSSLRLQCEAPHEARPGSRVNITLKTNMPERVVPVQLIVKDQRLITPSDPQVELAAAIKQNLSEWAHVSYTGVVERQLSNVKALRFAPYVMPDVMPMLFDMPSPLPAVGSAPPQSASGRSRFALHMPSMPFRSGNTDSFATVSATAAVPIAAPVTTDATVINEPTMPAQSSGALSTATQTATAMLSRMRLQFPEIIYNALIPVKGEASVEVRLGDGMARYSVEAFAISPETLDWQRAETSIQASQPVYGELTVSPFVFPGDPVLGRLDVGAASGQALVEVRHDGELLPLLHEDGTSVAKGERVASGTILRFPVSPGAITAIVRDAESGETDVSERYVTEPGKLRHIVRRLRLLTPGDEVTLSELQALELRPLPGLERPFQFLVEGAVKYPFGCIEQTSTKVLAMYTGYITNQDNAELAAEYEAAIPVWYRRLKSMYLPGHGFSFYPPEEGGSRTTDTHYAPRGVRHLLKLPTAERSGIRSSVLREMLDDIHKMAREAAKVYDIDYPPQQVKSCHDAYRVIIAPQSSAQQKAEAAAYVRSRLVMRNEQTFVEVAPRQPSYQWLGGAVSTREETAYAAAALLAMRDTTDLALAIAATNYLTAQLNEEGRLYSTVDTAACLSLLLELRQSGVIATGGNGRVILNGQEMGLREALSYEGKVESLRCNEGIIAVQVTSEFTESWSAFKSQVSVEVRLEKNGQAQQRFKVGDALDLVVRVPRYEPGMLVHVCLPDALARVVGGGQVKRFSMDFCEKNELRIPLAAVGSTTPPDGKVTRNSPLDWFGLGQRNTPAQHWAVIVRNMFKEEQIGNPGLLQVVVE